MRKFAILFCLALFAPSALASGSSDPDQTNASAKVPHIVLAGLEAYRAKGSADDAVKVWTVGSPLEGSKAALSETNTLHQVEALYGTYRAFDVLRVLELSDRIRVVYLTLDYEKGPLFGKFMVYRTDQGWILTSFDFNTEEEKILPYVPWVAAGSGAS